MDELIRLWNASAISGLHLASKLRDAIEKALREAYSEGHCDGQNAVNYDDPDVYPRDTGRAWARSQTLGKVDELK